MLRSGGGDLDVGVRRVFRLRHYPSRGDPQPLDRHLPVQDSDDYGPVVSLKARFTITSSP